MNQNEPKTSATAVKISSKAKRLKKFFCRLMAVLLVLIGLLIALLVWCSASESGFAWTIAQISQHSKGVFAFKQVNGTLWRGFSVSGLKISGINSKIDLDNASLNWSASELFYGRLHLTRLELGNLKITAYGNRQKSPSPAPRLPASLKLPLSIQLDKLSIQSLTLGGGKIVLYQSALNYRYAKGQHSLQVEQLASPWGQLNGLLSVADARPFKLAGKLKLQLNMHEPYSQGVGNINLAGDLKHTQVSAQYRGERLLLALDSHLIPFAANPLQKLKDINLRVSRFNPHSLDIALPKAMLNLDLFIKPSGQDALNGKIRLDNLAADSLQNKGIPLKTLTGDLSIKPTQLFSQNLSAELLHGSLKLSGKLSEKNLNLRTELKQVALADFAVKFDQQKLLSGTITSNGALTAPHFAANLKTENLQAIAELSLGKKSQHGRILQIKSSKISAKNGGRINLQGKLQLGDEQKIDLKAKLENANPQRFYSLAPEGKLNALLLINGHIARHTKLQASAKFSDSTLSGKPLNGNISARLDDKRLSALQANLHIADNSLIASGAWGRAGDKLIARIDAGNLAPLGMGFSGSINGQITLSGTPQVPELDSAIKAENLKLPNGFSVKQVNFSGKASSSVNAPLSLVFNARGIQSEQLNVEQIDLNINGSRAKQQINSHAKFVLAKHTYQFNLLANGSLNQKNFDWTGQVSRLELIGDAGIRLLNPLNIQASAQRLSLSAAKFSLLNGNLNLNSLLWQKGKSVISSGQASGISLAALNAWLPILTEQNMLFNADWEVNLGGASNQGFINLKRQSGDIKIPFSDGQRVAAGLSNLQAQIKISNAGSAFKIDLASRFASFQTQGTLNHGRALPNLLTPINATLQANIPSLKALQAFLPVGLNLSGKFVANVGLQGSLTARNLNGTISGENLGLYDRTTGVKLENGTLAMHLNGQRIILDKLRFTSQRKRQLGDVVASGELELQSDIPSVKANVIFNKFSVFSKPGRRLIVSGSSDLGVSTLNGISLKGKLLVDFGRIDLPKESAPSLSDDIIVVGTTLPEPSALSKLPISVDMQLDLGEKFRFAGEGLSVDLGGQLNINASHGLAPTAKGQVKIIKGRYKAYGQDLDINQGSITFNGPLDNPTLKVRAERHLSPVGAGVEVTGSVSQPQVRLVANESMTDKEKLAWLVLGHSASGSQDNDALAIAAGSFLAGSINNKIGILDDIGVVSKQERLGAGGQISPAEQVITIGKQVTQKIYIGYEYGISSADQAVKMSYKLSKAWSFILRVGQDSSSTEARFTHRFD